MHIFEKEFDFVIHRAKSLERPARMVVAGADCENIWGDTLLKQYDRAFCEALAPCENTSARAFMVTYNGVRAEISINGETRTKEVRHYG